MNKSDPEAMTTAAGDAWENLIRAAEALEAAKATGLRSLYAAALRATLLRSEQYQTALQAMTRAEEE